MKVIFHHNQRSSFGGEDVAIQNIVSRKTYATSCTYKFKKQKVRALVLFMISPSHLINVLRQRRAVHVIVNPFPNVSLLAVCLLSVFGIKQRWYIHHFGMSCVAGTHYREKEVCFKCSRKRDHYHKTCSGSIARAILHLFVNRYFLKLFLSFKKNKIYAVSQYQKALAIENGVPKNKIVIVGNLL